MKFLLNGRLVQSVAKALGYCAHYAQHVLMKAAVAVSLKLCLFTARTLLQSSAQEQASQSY